MKRVYEALNPTDAYLLREILDTRGIEAVVKGDLLWAARGDVPENPSVWVVKDEDYEGAKQVVREYLSKDVAGKKEWKCKKCGEIIEGQFSECWQCGTERSQGGEE